MYYDMLYIARIVAAADSMVFEFACIFELKIVSFSTAKGVYWKCWQKFFPPFLLSILNDFALPLWNTRAVSEDNFYDSTRKYPRTPLDEIAMPFRQ